MFRLTRLGLPGAALAAGLVLTACAPAEPVVEVPIEEDRGFIPGGKYVLVGMDGAAVPLRNLSMEIKENGVSGTGPCNGYAAANHAELPAVALEPIRTTNVTCDDIEIESRFLSVLQSATAMEYYGGVLKVKAPSTWLIFERGVRADSAVNALDTARGQQ